MSETTTSTAAPRPTALRLVLAVLCTGAASGLGGAAMSWTLHEVQSLLFGGEVPAYQDPYAGAAPGRRLLVLLGTGAVVTLLWWLLRRPAVPIQGVNAMVKGETPVQRRPPMLRGVLNAFVQILAVGGGAPIGREVAPREFGALAAARISDGFGIEPATRRILVACGAAAGLAAVYHVPLAGAVFALEVLLGALSVRTAVMALATSGLAAVVARIAVSPEPFYRVPAVDASWPVLLGAVAVGLLVAVPAWWFGKAVARAEAARLRGGRMLAGLPLAFLLTGLAALAFPQVLGNGLAAAQWAYDGAPLGPVLVVLLLKALLVLAVLGCGAVGGTLTPSFALGALAGTALAQLLGAVLPGTDAASLSVIASAAFLAVTMKAPMTAIMLAVGFTEQPAESFLPVALAVAASTAVAHGISERSARRVPSRLAP